MRMVTWVRNLGLCSAVVVLAGFAAGDANAASMTVHGWTLGERVNVRSAGRTGWVNTAELDVTYDGRDGFSYCVDLAQNIGAGTSTGWDTLQADLSQSVLRAPGWSSSRGRSSMRSWRPVPRHRPRA